jgi:hypothetical protein
VNKSYFEILTEINNEEDHDKQVVRLQEAVKLESFRTFFAEFYSPQSTIKFPAMDAGVNFTPFPYSGQETALYRQQRGFYAFRQPSPLNHARQKNVLIQILETLDKNDAEMLAYHSRKGKLPFKRITRELITEALGWVYTATEMEAVLPENTIVINTAPPVEIPVVETPVVEPVKNKGGRPRKTPTA